MAEKTQYGAEQIQVLEGLEPVRKRPGMYIGGTGVEGLHHLVWEIINNSIDEVMAGRATTVRVTLREDGGVAVSVVNALSTRLVAEVRREGKVWQQEYEGGEPKSDVKAVGKYDDGLTG